MRKTSCTICLFEFFFSFLSRLHLTQPAKFNQLDFDTINHMSGLCMLPPCQITSHLICSCCSVRNKCLCKYSCNVTALQHYEGHCGLEWTLRPNYVCGCERGWESGLVFHSVVRHCKSTLACFLPVFTGAPVHSLQQLRTLLVDTSKTYYFSFEPCSCLFFFFFFFF